MVILFDMFNLSDDVYEIIFSTPQQKIVAEVLIKTMKGKGGSMNKSEMSFFATKLHEGELVTEINDPKYKGRTVKLSYNKRQFYDRILTPMKSMGLVYFDLYKKTYNLSDKFSKELQKISFLWQQELKKEEGARIKNPGSP